MEKAREAPVALTRYTRPEFGAAVLIIVDTQRDTLEGKPFAIPGVAQILPALGALVQGFRAAARPIVHVIRLYVPDGSNAELCRKAAIEDGLRIFTPGSRGADIVPALLEDPAIELDATRLLRGELQPAGPGEWIIYKPRWGAFHGTRLEKHLRHLGVSTLVFAGCNWPNCPRASIYEASSRDFRIVVARDAMAGLYPRGEDEMREIGVSVMPVSAIVDSL
jgi:nicotinamidase-related amidase